MTRWGLAATALAIATPAFAHSYRIVLDKPANGKLLIGHAGVQAVDDRTASTLVRVVAPGNAVDQRGTVRVLVMNLSDKPFMFGPDDVTLRLGDGTVFKPTSIDKMENGRILVETESRHAATIDIINRNSAMSSIDNGSAVGASSPGANASAAGSGASSAAAGQDLRTDSDLLPGAGLLNAIYQILIPLEVAPQKAWGGYYVFDVPRDVQRRKADQPLTIMVRTGGEQHRFSGTLRWK